ncbi:MAG: thioredoxin family protein [Limisphaerales bacterium]
MNTNENITKTLHLTAASFEAEVLKSKQPVLVVFGAPWSRPCQVIDSILQELARDWAGKVKVVKVDADDSLDLSLWYEIQSVPTLICFVEGKPCLRIVGTASKEAILNLLNRLGDTSSSQASTKERASK